MNHYAWTYVAGEGRNTKVGLYHGSKTGHLMIYVGKKIVAIDFKVFNSKEYSFFIDEELCRIKLERRGDEMYYFFEIDKRTDTPLNRARWAREKKYLKQMLIAFGVLGLLITLFVIWSNTQDSGADADKLLLQQGVETVGKVSVGTEKENPDVYFQFIAGSRTASGKMKKDPIAQPVSQNHMPLETGDEFVVRYVPSKPSLNRIYISRPTKRQIAIYKERAVERQLRAHLDMNPAEAMCLVELAFEMEGVGGLADFFFQNTPPDKNPHHNSATYRRLVSSQAFVERAKACPPSR